MNISLDMPATAKRSILPLLTGASLLVVLFGARRAAADETAHADAALPLQISAEPRYRLAISADAAAGGQGYDAETIGAMAELGVRFRLLPMFDIGGTFSRLEVDKEFRASALGVHAAWHPFAGRLDPYLRLGPTYFARMRGRRQYDSDSKASRLGLEGVLGLDLAWQSFAFGPELRYGQTNETWLMLGLHVEGRL